MIRNELYTGYYSFIRGKQIYCASNSERVVLFTSQSPLEGDERGRMVESVLLRQHHRIENLLHLLHRVLGRTIEIIDDQ